MWPDTLAMFKSAERSTANRQPRGPRQVAYVPRSRRKGSGWRLPVRPASRARQERTCTRPKNAESRRGTQRCLGRRSPDALSEDRPLRHGGREGRPAIRWRFGPDGIRSPGPNPVFTRALALVRPRLHRTLVGQSYPPVLQAPNARFYCDANSASEAAQRPLRQ